MRMLDDVTKLAAPGSWIGLDAMNSEMLTSQWTHPLIETMEKAGVPWKGALDDPERVLAERGWRATLAQLGDEGLNFGRWRYPVIPSQVPFTGRFFEHGDNGDKCPQWRQWRQWRQVSFHKGTLSGEKYPSPPNLAPSLWTR